jgi:hypothetical protein
MAKIAKKIGIQVAVIKASLRLYHADSGIGMRLALCQE